MGIGKVAPQPNRPSISANSPTVCCIALALTPYRFEMALILLTMLRGPLKSFREPFPCIARITMSYLTLAPSIASCGRLNKLPESLASFLPVSPLRCMQLHYPSLAISMTLLHLQHALSNARTRVANMD